jgi:hypothetical protein
MRFPYWLTIAAVVGLTGGALHAQAPKAEDHEERGCVLAEVIKGNVPEGLTLLNEMKDEELATFNRNYESQYKKPAPDNDLVLIFGNDELEHVWLASFAGGCLQGNIVVMPKNIFKDLHDGRSV